MPKFVVSSTLDKADWNNTTVLKGDVVESVSKLKQQHEVDIVVHGSARLVQTLLEHDFVDELRLMVFPVVLGRGQRLFGDASEKLRLRLSDSRTVGDGIEILTYVRPSAVELGLLRAPRGVPWGRRLGDRRLHPLPLPRLKIRRAGTERGDPVRRLTERFGVFWLS